MQQQMSALFTSFVYLLILLTLSRYIERTNWRNIVFTAVALSVVVTTQISLLTVFGVIRNQYFFLLQDVMVSLPSASMYLVAVLATVRVAPHGQEATMHAIVTTTHALALPIGRACANALYGALPTWFGLPAGCLSLAENYKHDTPEFRTTVAVSVCLSSAVVSLSVLFLVGLPRTKLLASVMRIPPPDGKRRVYWGVVVVVVFFIAVCLGLSLNVIALFPTVRCTVLVGGTGCT